LFSSFFCSDTKKKATTTCSSQTHRRQKTQKKTKKETKTKQGTYLQALILPSHFWLSLLPSRFCTSISSVFLWHLLLFKQKILKKHKEQKPIEKKKYVEKGGSLLSSSHFAFSLLAPASTLPLLHFCFKCFLLTSSSQAEKKKKNTKKKKTHREKKICKKRRELTFKLPLYPLTFGS
jgi:hypothetical protein